MASTSTNQFKNLKVDKDPYGVAQENRAKRERFKAMKSVAESRPQHDPRGKSYSDEQIEKLVMDGAYLEGAKTAGTSLLVFGSGAYAANVFSPFFRKRLGPSGKMAAVVMPVLGLTALSMELFITRARKDKQTFLDHHLGFEAPRTNNGDDSHLSMPKRAANFIYRYPYYTLGVAGVTAVGTVFAMQPKELSLQQKILHSRVMGQMSVLGILCTLMGSLDYMRRNGGEFTE